MKYFFVLKDQNKMIRALSRIYHEEFDGPYLNANLARWISHGFPECEGEDNGAGVLAPGDSIDIEWAIDDEHDDVEPLSRRIR